MPAGRSAQRFEAHPHDRLPQLPGSRSRHPTAISLRLRPDTPDAFVEELRYHLGLSEQAPATSTLDWQAPALTADGCEDLLAGGPTATPIRQLVPPWLARWSLTDGWIGFAREELDLNPWLNFYAARGHAYAAPPGQEPPPLTTQAAPFTPAQTTEQSPSQPKGGLEKAR
jgi:hypothetical protein